MNILGVNKLKKVLIDFRLLEMQRQTGMTTPVDLENTWTFNLISR